MARKKETPVWGRKSTVNDWMMKYIGLPIVWGWLTAALAIVGMGIVEPEAVMPMLEGFISLLAIVGTLATLIVTSMLELWKSEQTQEIGTMEDRIAHRHRLEEMEMSHQHKMAEIQANNKFIVSENDNFDKEMGIAKDLKKRK